MVGVAPSKISWFCGFAFLNYDAAKLMWSIIANLYTVLIDDDDDLHTDDELHYMRAHSKLSSK